MNKPQHDNNTVPAVEIQPVEVEAREAFTVDTPAAEDISVVPFARGPLTDVNFGF